MATISYEKFIATMSKIESEAPPAYSPYERNATSDQIAADSDTRNLNNHIGEIILFRKCQAIVLQTFVRLTSSIN